LQHQQVDENEGDTTGKVKMEGGKMPHMRIAKGHVMLKERGGGELSREGGEGRSRGGGQSRMAYDSIRAGTPQRSGSRQTAHG